MTRFGRRELQDYLELRPSQWLPLPQRRWYYPGLLPVDAGRLVALYQAHGYHQANVVDVVVETHERRRRSGRRRGHVDITWVVEEGAPTRVDALVVRWPEGGPPGPPRSVREGPFVELPSLDPHRLSSVISLTKGEPFEVPALLGSKAALREALRRLGHPFAEVAAQARVDRAARLADVTFTVRPGPYMTLGTIAIAGLDTVPAEPVMAEIEPMRGRPYAPERIDAIERRVYALGVFSTVIVEAEDAAAERADPDGQLDLIVRVQEADPQRVRLGAALGFETNRWEQRLLARYEHENLFRDLYKLRVVGRLGYAELPSLVRPLAHGPAAALDLLGQKKGLLEAQLVWTIEPSVEVGIEQGYQYWALRHRFGVSRFFTRWFQAELSHSLRYVDFFDVAEGLAVRDRYALSYLGAAATVWAVDAMAAPNDGAVIGADYKLAGGPFGGQFDYHELVTFARGYWRPLGRLQLAARAEIGLILPFGDRPGAPIDMRRYLGGTGSVRGWGRRRLAPRVIDCDASGACEAIPVGGNTSVLGNLEIRVLALAPVWVAAFLDVGDVQPGVAQFEPSRWNYAAGGGVRIESPVGKFRLDVGVHLNATEISRGEPIWGVHFGLGESF